MRIRNSGNGEARLSARSPSESSDLGPLFEGHVKEDLSNTTSTAPWKLRSPTHTCIASRQRQAASADAESSLLSRTLRKPNSPKTRKSHPFPVPSAKIRDRNESKNRISTVGGSYEE